MIARGRSITNVIFHQAALGDFVLIWPLLRAMTGRTVVVAPWSRAKLAAQMLAHVEPVDIEMLEFTRLHAAGGPTSLSPMVRELFNEAQRVVSFISDGTGAWAENVRRVTPAASVYFVRPRPANDWTRHVTAWHEAQLERQDWALSGRANGQAVSRTGAVVVHPGSGGPRKLWPIERWARLIDRLRGTGREVRVIAGEAETPDVVRVLNATVLHTLEELFEVLNAASRFVGHDSGPTHLAAQMGLATVAMFGPTDPRVWRPIGPAVTVLAPEQPCDMDWLAVEAVWAALSGPWPA